MCYWGACVNVKQHTMEKEYKKEDLIIGWKPEVCIHSAICAKGLPAVFKPKERPWIQTEGVSKEEIKQQVMKCPSGAIFLKNE